jgi:type IV pilus assembly protein PilM
MKLKSVGDFFGLDIGSTAIRVVELQHSGHGWNLKRYGLEPIDIRLSESTAAKDIHLLGEAITRAITNSGIRSRNVAIGIPSNKMFASVVEIPNVPKNELNATIKYQAENYVPMRAGEAKIDWAVVGESPMDKGKIEVLVASVQNSFTEARLDLLESLGLNVIAIEPDSIALTRSLLPDDVTDGRALIDMGDFSTDLVMTLGMAPRLVRSIPIGFRTLVRASKQNLGIEEHQSEQLIMKFGIDPSKLEGQIARSVTSPMEQLLSEVTKSLKFFTTKYNNIGVGAILVSGYASTIPGVLDYLTTKTGVAGQIATPWQHVNVPKEVQPDLAPVSAQFAVAVGLAERVGD